MHKRARLATTAGATVLTFAAMGGMAQADPVGDLTGGLTDTVGGVVDTATGGAVHLSSGAANKGAAAKSRTKSSAKSSGTDPSLGLRLGGPVHANANVRANSSARTGTQVDASVNAGVRSARGTGDAISAGISAGVDTCGFAPEECGAAAPPPGTPPGAPPGTPPTGTSPGATGPSGVGPVAPGAEGVSSIRQSLPFTGGPLGALTGIGLAAVLTGSAAVAGSRIRARRDED
ncbi:MAG TPA: hypothetical protein VH912_04870 [Streptosporangiaceae bacterium]|jgi:hypothetical protein